MVGCSPPFSTAGFGNHYGCDWDFIGDIFWMNLGKL